MKRSILLWQFAGLTFASILGTLLHFLFEWTGFSLILAPFCAVNESTWEHMKLAYFPMLIFAIIQGRYFAKDNPSFWKIKLLGTVVALALIPVCFYTLGGSIGQYAGWINIILFFVALSVAYLLEGIMLKRPQQTLQKAIKTLWILLLVTIGILFMIFTFATPQIPLFLDPVTGKFGINAIY